MNITIAIDCMGGDHGPAVTVPAALAFLNAHPDAEAILVGREEELAPLVEGAQAGLKSRLRIHNATQVVGMDEPPASVRAKKDSSMRVALHLVKNGQAQAAVSAGNTGALVMISRFALKTFPGIDRPAICFALPTIKGHTYALDLGGNVDCTPEHLFEFGIMGAMLASALDHNERPTVGLLNVGAEEIKGNELTKRASELLRASSLNYYGYVEGDDIFKGTTDVVVCDGFAGNVALKTSEGLVKMLGTFLRDEIKRGPLSMLMGLVAMPVLRRFKNRANPGRYNGAVLLGLRGGVVLKSHGSADAYAFEQALGRAADAVANNLIQRIRDKMEAMMDMNGENA
ncbi:MAG: phosphate acyltransferase PlsX [Proteobacteria bacterium]|jgi:glycerol-3-phosphate acyltransferase PlsX|nr:phosphate acyltransferase PlsX [Pseudomonadota bacterium]